MNTTTNENKWIRFERFKFAAILSILSITGLLLFTAFNYHSYDYSEIQNNKEQFSSLYNDVLLGNYVSNNADEKIMLQIREGLNHFNNKQYKSAIRTFEEYIANNKGADNYEKIELKLAIAYLNSGATDRSTELLEKLKNTEQIDIMEDAIWYLSLAYARTGIPEDAKAHLELLSESEKYSAKIQKLLHSNHL